MRGFLSLSPPPPGGGYGPVNLVGFAQYYDYVVRLSNSRQARIMLLKQFLTRTFSNLLVEWNVKAVVLTKLAQEHAASSWL